MYRFRDIASYLSKVADFDPPHLHLAPPQGVIPVEFRGDLRRPKTGFPGLSCGVVCVIPRLAVLVELRLVTDRQTDGLRQSLKSHLHDSFEFIGAIEKKLIYLSVYLSTQFSPTWGQDAHENSRQQPRDGLHPETNMQPQIISTHTALVKIV